MEVWGNNTKGDGIKGLEKSKDGSETLSVDMSKFTGMSNLGGKFENMFNLLSVFSKLIVNKLFDKNSPYFSSDDDDTFDSFKVSEDEHAGSKYKIFKYYLRNNQSNVKWTTIDTILDKEVNLDTLRKRKLKGLNIFDLSKRTVIDSIETQDHE